MQRLGCNQGQSGQDATVDSVALGVTLKDPTQSGYLLAVDAIDLHIVAI
jgi:hypothetical protein